MKSLKNTLTNTGVALLTGAMLNAQTPLFTGMAGKPVALEARAHLGEQAPGYTGFAKFFPKGIPAWAYIGNTYSKGELGESLYGIGPSINIKDRAYFLPTLEGAGGMPNMFTLYSTFNFGNGRYLDINPTISKENPVVTSINLHKTYNGVTFGATTEFQNGKFGKLKDMTWRIAKVKNGNFVDFGVNFGKRSVRVAAQRAFGN